MYSIMGREEFEINEDILNKYDYVEIKEDNKNIGLYVPKRYADDVKNLVDTLKAKKINSNTAKGNQI